MDRRKMKPYRQSVIRELVERESITSQEQLRARLRERGIDATQATLSRDIRELGLVKGGADGAYQAPGRSAPNGKAAESMLHRAVAEYLLRVNRVQQLVLLHTGLGRAQALCVTLDDARLPEVVGTVAGEDTVLVVAPDARRAKALVKRLERLTGEGQTP